jgi:hypothetical protein
MNEMQILDDVVLIDVIVGGSTGERTVESNDFIREVGRMLPKGTFSWISKYRSEAKREILKVGVARKVDTRVIGYFVPSKFAKQVSEKLLSIREQFLAEKAIFLQKVPTLIEEWASHPTNAIAKTSGVLQADLIRLHAPRPSELDRMLKFAMSATMVKSAGVFGEADSLITEVKGLAGQAAAEIADDIKVSWKGPAGGKTTSRVLGLVRRIRNKADAMAILSPKFTDLRDMCDKVIQAVPATGTIEGIEFLQVSALLEYCSKPDNILTVHSVPFDPLDVVVLEPESQVVSDPGTVQMPLESLSLIFGTADSIPPSVETPTPPPPSVANTPAAFLEF